MDIYEKKYKDALERARKLYKDAITLQLEQDIKDYETIFPELADSEDERIRNLIINHLTQERGSLSNDEAAEAIAWLEKQESVGEIVSRCKKSWYNEGKIAGMAEGLSNDDKYQQGWHDALEKQGEQKTWLNSLKNRVIQQPKSTWSEDDEEILRTIISDGIRGAEFDMLQIDWLKSIKQRMEDKL